MSISPSTESAGSLESVSTRPRSRHSAASSHRFVAIALARIDTRPSFLVFMCADMGLCSIGHQLAQDESANEQGTEADQQPRHEPMAWFEKKSAGPLLALKKGEKAKIDAFNEN